MNDKITNAKHEPSAPAGAAVAEGSIRRSPLTLGRIVAVTAAFSLMVGIIVGPIIANNHAQGADTSVTPEHTVTVSGVGEVSVAPDTADVMIGVSVTKPTVKDARAGAATSMTAIIAAVKKVGIADKDIVTTNVSLSPVYDYTSSAPRLTGYQFSNSLKVTVRDLTKVADVIDDSSTAGATIIQGISFRLDNPKSVETQARQLAMADARSRADALAQAAGVSIKGVATINETSASSPINYYPSYAAAGVSKDAVSTPIQTGTTDITVQVTVSYLIG
ncbi:MAG: SIMPL domain-containing protein [Candidatus Limnocylindrales bacterium]|jgi:uncharacterized protein YggE